MWGVIIHSLLFHFTCQPHIAAPLQLCLSFPELIFTFLRVHFFSFYTYLLMDFCVFLVLYHIFHNPFLLFSFEWNSPPFSSWPLLCWTVLVAVKFPKSPIGAYKSIVVKFSKSPIWYLPVIICWRTPSTSTKYQIEKKVTCFYFLKIKVLIGIT